MYVAAVRRSEYADASASVVFTGVASSGTLIANSTPIITKVITAPCSLLLWNMPFILSLSLNTGVCHTQTVWSIKNFQFSTV